MNKDNVNFLINIFIAFIITQLTFEYFFPSSQEAQEQNLVPIEAISKPKPNEKISFKTDEYQFHFDEQTGVLQDIELNNYLQNESTNVKTLFESNDDGTGKQLLRTGLLYWGLNKTAEQKQQSEQTTELVAQEVVFDNITFTQLDDQRFSITKSSEQLGIKFTQTYVPKGQYQFEIIEEISSDQPQEVFIYKQLENTHKAFQPGTIPGMGMFQGASFSTKSTNYKKIPFSKFHKQRFNEASDNGWFSFSQRYFATALSPSMQGTFYSKYIAENEESIAGFVTKSLEVGPNQTQIMTTKVFSGPEKTELLKNFDPNLVKVIDYGIFWPLSQFFFNLLTLIHQVIHNWGYAIILSTLLFKLLLAPLMHKSFVASAKIKKLQPELEKIKEQFKDDQQGYMNAVSSYYSQSNINPLSPILPIFLQIPFFIAFYAVLTESVELRSAPFESFILDLSIPDPTYALPIIAGLSMLLQQFVTPTQNADPTMKMAMYIMVPLVTALFTQLPSGLMLYIITSNLFSILQTGLTQRALSRNSPA